MIMNNKLNIISIDISIDSVGFAVFIQGKLDVSFVLKTKNKYKDNEHKNRADKLKQISDKIIAIYNEYEQQNIKFDCIAYENPMFIQYNIEVAMVLAMVKGAVNLTASFLGIDPFPIQPQVWKKLIIGRGDAKKEEIASKLRYRYGIENKRAKGGNLKNDDELDAIGIGLYYLNKDKIFL